MARPKAVYKYDLHGNFLAEYPSINQAAKRNNRPFSSVRKTARGDYAYTGSFIFSHEKHKKIAPQFKTKYEQSRVSFKPVIAVKDRREIYFESTSECARFIGCNRSAVSQIINKIGNMKTIYGWSVQHA